MLEEPSVRCRWLAVAVGLVLLFWCQAATARPDSDLEGKELVAAGDAQADARAILGALLLKDSASLDKVVVKEDGDLRLVVTVTGANLGGKRLVGRTWGSDRAPQREVGCDPVTVDAGATEADLIFALDPSLPEGTTVDSPYLHLMVMRSGLPVPEKERTFALGKRWQVPVSPENVVTRIVLRPEGAAARLRETQVQIVMPKVQMMKVGYVARPATVRPTPTPKVKLQRSLIAARPMALARVQATPTAVAMARPVAVKTHMLSVAAFKLGLPAEDTSRGARGPGANSIDLLSEVASDISLPAAAILSISPEVYQDQNAASGIFYYLPQGYHLRWDPDQGYALKMLYGAATAEGQAGEVVMAASLDAGVQTGEIQFARQLIQAYLRRHPGSTFTELRRMPIDKAPEVSLSGGLQHSYDIPADRITLNAISDALGEIEVQWVTDTVTKENLQLALVEDVGINGATTFTPSGGGLPPQSRPVEIEIADPATFGEFVFRRGAAWRNRTPYPLRLKYVHALLLENDLPVIYSWSLADTRVPPKAQVEFDASAVPSWLDGRARRMWIDYAVAGDCHDCDQEVIAAITGGVTSVAAAQITFHTLSPLADIDAAEIDVMVRSQYFDTRSREVQTRGPVVLDGDGQDFTVGPIYDNREADQSGALGPLFEYQLEVIMKDGASHSGAAWIPADRLRVPIGSVQVREALGFLPGEQQ